MDSRPCPRIVDQIMSLEHGVLRVFRDSPEDIGFREAVLYLDGEEVANVEFKRHIDLEIQPGKHRLKAYNRVFNTPEIEFTVNPGERVSFQVANVGGWWFGFFMLFQMGIPRITLRREPSELTLELESPKDSSRLI